MLPSLPFRRRSRPRSKGNSDTRRPSGPAGLEARGRIGSRTRRLDLEDASRNASFAREYFERLLQRAEVLIEPRQDVADYFGTIPGYLVAHALEDDVPF